MITIAAAGAMGILVQRSELISWWTWFGVVGLALVGLAVTTGSRRWAAVLLLVAAGMAIRWEVDEAIYRQATLRGRVSEEAGPAFVQGKVRGLVRRTVKPGGARNANESPWQTRFDLWVEEARDGHDWVACTGGLSVLVEDDVNEVRAGDRVRLAGQLSAIRPATNPSGFDWRAVARHRHQHGRLVVDSRRQVEVLERSRWSVWGLADRLARHGELTLRDSLGRETGALAAALVVGRRQAIDHELQDQLLETGTVHLLSVSGLHLGIVAVALHYLAILLGLRRSAQLLLVGVGCLLFVAITGARPPVIRAATLVGVVLLARYWERQDSPLNSLALAAWLLLIAQPTHLFQVGVQLSFVAVTALFLCGQRVDRLTEQLRAEDELDRLLEATHGPVRRWLDRWLARLGDGLWFSLCVTLATAPLVWFHFHVFSPVAVIANVLLSGLLAIGLISGLVAVCVGWVGLPLAVPVGWICFAALWLMQLVIGWAAEVPWGHFWLPAPPGWWVVSYYLAVVAGLTFLPAGFPGRRWSFVIGSLAWCLVAGWAATAPGRRGTGDLMATFLDVGHGTSVIVRPPDGRTLVYDCGSLGNVTHSARGIQEPLWSLGVTRIDRVLLSHADADHYNALPGLLRRFAVDELVVPVGMLDVPKEGLVAVREAIRRAGVRVREVSREDVYLAGDDAIEILHPPRERVPGNDNANSLVVGFRHAGRMLILPGDLESPGLERVLDLPRPPPGGVLMAPHHGSLTLDNRAMLDWARPSQVVVSGGVRAKRPEVADILGERGSQVHITARDGAVRVRLTSAGIEVRSWLREPW